MVCPVFFILHCISMYARFFRFPLYECMLYFHSYNIIPMYRHIAHLQIYILYEIHTKLIVNSRWDLNCIFWQMC